MLCVVIDINNNAGTTKPRTGQKLLCQQTTTANWEFSSHVANQGQRGSCLFATLW